MEGKRKILIFDDEEDILDICKYVLEKRGYEIITKESCHDIISDVNECQPDVVIMDNWIPGVGGVKAIQTLKNDSRFKDLPVIFFSASKDIQSLTIESKADAYIEKPFDIKEIEEKVDELLG